MELKINTYFESPKNLLTCKAEYNLGPYSTALVTVLLEPAAPVIRTDEILISSINWSSIQIMESKSDIIFYNKRDCYKATALLANVTNKRVTGIVQGKIEILPPKSYLSYAINSENKNKLKKIMSEIRTSHKILLQCAGTISATSYLPYIMLV